jgi:hypothetical protein
VNITALPAAAAAAVVVISSASSIDGNNINN